MDHSKKDCAKRNGKLCLFDVSPERLNQMTPLELEEEMEQALEAMTEETYDPEIVDAYLAALDCKAPMPTPPNQEAAYGALQAKLSQAIKGQEKVFKSGTSSGRRRSAIKIGLAVAAAVVCLLGSMVIAQATGADVFGVLARWTEQTFSFGYVRSNDPKEPVDSDPQQENNEEFASKLPPEYQELWVELQARGVYSFSFPTYLPDGFEFDESDLTIFPESDTIDYTSWYINGSDEIAFGVLLSDNTNNTFEKDTGDVETFTMDGLDYYIFTNNRKNVAVWHSDNLEYSLSTTLPISELEIILNNMSVVIKGRSYEKIYMAGIVSRPGTDDDFLLDDGACFGL